MSDNPRSVNYQRKHRKPQSEWADPDIPEWESTITAEGRAHRRAGLADAALEGVSGAHDFTAEEIALAKAALKRRMR